MNYSILKPLYYSGGPKLHFLLHDVEMIRGAGHSELSFKFSLAKCVLLTLLDFHPLSLNVLFYKSDTSSETNYL